MAEYELVLMLDAGLEESKRESLAGDARTLIEGSGELKHADNWGVRNMAYEIELRTEADYRYFRFVAPKEMLPQLDHNLKIADGVVRFRVFRVDPDAPVAAPPAASQSHSAPAPTPAPAAAAAETPPPETPAPPAEPEPPVTDVPPAAAEVPPPPTDDEPAAPTEPAAPAEAAAPPAEAPEPA